MVLAVPALAQESLPYTTDLIMDGRDTAMDVGDFAIDADGMITFQINEFSTGWRLEETHLYVGDKPPAKSAPGRFPYQHIGLGGAASDIFYVDFAAADLNGDGIVYIAGHVQLTMQIGTDPVTGEPIFADETAWAQGDQSAGKGQNWTTYGTVNLSTVTPA